MKRHFNKVSGIQDKEIIHAHCAAIYVCQTLAKRGVDEDKFMEYIKNVFCAASDEVEYKNILRLREQLDDILPEGLNI